VIPQRATLTPFTLEKRLRATITVDDGEGILAIRNRRPYLHAQTRREPGSKREVGLSGFSTELALIGFVLFFLGSYYMFTHPVRSGALYDHVLEGG
jgi:hypothetical protein